MVAPNLVEAEARVGYVVSDQKAQYEPRGIEAHVALSDSMEKAAFVLNPSKPCARQHAALGPVVQSGVVSSDWNA